MPLKLPSVLGSVRIPRYFAHDFLQRTRYAHAFTASWPSLFVAAPHTKSSLHVDQWSGNFWMAMVKGTKRWTLFHKDDVAFCAPDYSRGTLDPAFPRLHEMDEARALEKTKTKAESDVSGEGHPHNDVPFFGAFPFLPYARRWDVDLGPGEVLFVPGGFPHVVHNLDVTVSFAGNYVDESNLDEALRDMALLGAKYGDAMRASHAAIDEVWFDENDEVWVEERLEPKQLVVRYEDYRGGAAGFWGAEDWQGVESAEGKALTAA
jgi:solute carrier family 25 thiamine pyrophosphate transporter 19